MGEKSLGFLSNSEYLCTVEVGIRRQAVSVCQERGTTQTIVKVPKY